MTSAQRKLLQALYDIGGTWDQYLRVVASGETHNSTTTLACFRWGWIESDGSRVELTDRGENALACELENHK